MGYEKETPWGATRAAIGATIEANNSPEYSTNDLIWERLPEETKAALLAASAQQRGVNGSGPETAGSDAQAINPWLAQMRTLADAYKPRSPLRYLVEKMIPEGSLSMFFGVPGGFKSMSLADLAVCVAGGRRWLALPDGGGGWATTAVPVLWIDCDNGKRRTDMRFDAIGKAHGLPDNSPLYYLSMPHPGLNLADINSAMILHDAVKAVNAGLVIIDNLGLIAGDVDENNSKMSTVMGELRRLIENTGAAVIVLHHQRKTADKDQQMNVIRGHSSIAASLDLAVHIGRDITDRDSRNVAVFLPVKMRDGDVPMMAAEFSYCHGETTNDLAEARFFGRAMVDTNSRHAVKQAIMTALYGGVRLNQKDLLAAVKEEGITAGVNTIRNMIENMVLKGELTEATGERNAKLYHLS
jgi:hypothetical protein